MNKKVLIFLIGFIVLAAVGALVFYFYKTPKSNSISPPVSDNFIQSTIQAPAVEGNIVNSGIAGRVVLLGGGPYEYEASLEIFPPARCRLHLFPSALTAMGLSRFLCVPVLIF